jgi:hypothetical protein
LKRVAPGEPLREIALSYNVDHSTISRLSVRHVIKPGGSFSGREHFGRSPGAPAKILRETDGSAAKAFLSRSRVVEMEFVVSTSLTTKTRSRG